MEDLAVFFRPLLARRARQLRSAGMETCQLAPDAEDRPERPWALRRALGNHRNESWSRSASFDVPLPTSIYTFPRPPPLACCPFPLFFYLRRMSNGGEDTQDDEAILARIKAGGPLEVYHLPRAILEGEDLPFVVVVEASLLALAQPWKLELTPSEVDEPSDGAVAGSCECCHRLSWHQPSPAGLLGLGETRSYS